ncbi:MAG TPA: SCO family protein [Lacunisphaera sp.]|nr:SCO family protein [Lacunisphaera sp.]
MALPGAAPASAAPTQVAGVDFEQRLGAQLPLDGTYRDDTGRSLPLRSYFGHGPVVLIFGYSRCPQLCSVVAEGTVETLRSLEPTVGRELSVLYVSIDPADTPRDMAAMKRRDAGRYGRSGSEGGWHYLTGSPAAIRRLTDAAGFHFKYDPATRLYAHAAGFLVLTPDGRASRYFPGVDFSAEDLATALERAGKGKTGESVFNLLLVCARGLGVSGRYGRLIWDVLGVAVGLTVVALFGGIAWMLRAERRRSGAASEGEAR